MDYKLGRIRSLITTRLNMLFSSTLPVRTTLEVLLKMKILTNEIVIAEHSKNAKQC